MTAKIILRLDVDEARSLLAVLEERWSTLDLWRGELSPENPIYDLLLNDQARYSLLAERLRIVLKRTT